MNARALLLSRVAEANAPSPFRQDDMPVDDQCRTENERFVGLRLSAEVRSHAIARAGAAMEAAYARFKRTQEATDLDRAHYHMRQMLTLAGIPYEGEQA